MSSMPSRDSGPGPGAAIETSRLLRAQRDQVWAAFSDPARLAQWWGPRGFSNTFHEFDFRAGGEWRFVMHAPQGGHLQNTSVFVEVVPPARLRFKQVSSPQFEMTITLAEHGDHTLIGWRQWFSTVEERDLVAQFAVDANEENLDRLEVHLATHGR